MPWRQVLDLSSFDPESIRLLGDVFDEAWARVESKVSLADYDAQRLELAKHIVEYAMKGERDRPKLIEYALFKFEFPD
jgi:hypothetical protein